MSARRNVTLKGCAARLAKSSRGAMALTLSQMFMGALTIGIATFRGTESYESFHVESQLGHSNYGATKLASDHARAANISANNNVVSTAIIGPRFAVEADNMTMIADALIACPQAHYNAKMAEICRQFGTNYPRMLVKLVWVRLKQAAVWAALGKLTEAIDKVMSLRAIEQIVNAARLIDSAVGMRVEDPTSRGSTWSGDSTSVACQDAMIDTLPSVMTGAAFPILMRPNLLEGLPKALVAVMPQLLCGGAPSMSAGVSVAGVGISANVSVGPGGVTGKVGSSGSVGGINWSAGTNVGGGGSRRDETTVKLPMVPAVAKQTAEACDGLERAMQSNIASRAAFPPEVAKYAACEPTGAGTGRDPSGGGADGALQSGAADEVAPAPRCTFDRTRCDSDKLEEHSAAFLASVGMPKISSKSASSLGGATHAPSDSDWNHSDEMRACAFSTKAIDPAVVRINDAARTIMTFGTARPSSTLRASHEYKTCGKWYFPDAEGQYAAVPHDQQPFVAGWKYALVGPKLSGRP